MLHASISPPTWPLLFASGGAQQLNNQIAAPLKASIRPMGKQSQSVRRIARIIAMINESPTPLSPPVDQSSRCKRLHLMRREQFRSILSSAAFDELV
ncbi:MAG: hypothetical protein AB7O88_06410 [Reyranellaceae bacterium]